MCYTICFLLVCFVVLVWEKNTIYFLCTVPTNNNMVKCFKMTDSMKIDLHFEHLLRLHLFEEEVFA